MPNATHEYRCLECDRGFEDADYVPELNVWSCVICATVRPYVEEEAHGES